MTRLIETRKRKARFLKSPDLSDFEDDLINKENNQFIDSIIQCQKVPCVEKIVSFDSLGKSSIKVSKLVAAHELPTQATRTLRDRKPLANLANSSDYTNSKFSVYDIFNDDEISDQDLVELVNKGRKKRNGTKKSTKASKWKREAEKIRQEEEALLKEAMREYTEIKNYKLIVETVQNDY